MRRTWGRRGGEAEREHDSLRGRAGERRFERERSRKEGGGKEREKERARSKEAEGVQESTTVVS